MPKLLMITHYQVCQSSKKTRDGLDAILKDNFRSIVSKSPTDIGRIKLSKMDIPIKDHLLHVDPTPYH